MDERPLPDRGFVFFEKGVIYRVPALPTGPKRELDAETLEVIRRGREKSIREYFERRRARGDD